MRCTQRLDDVTPEKLREKLLEHRDQVYLGQRPVDDRAGPAGRASIWKRPGSVTTTARRSSACSGNTSSGLLIERLPPISGESAAETVHALRSADGGDPIPAARVAGTARPTGWGPGRPVRAGSDPAGGRRAVRAPGDGELQLSLDFDAVLRPSVASRSSVLGGRGARRQ